MQLTAVDFQETNEKNKKSLSPSCLIWPEIEMTNIQPWRDCGQVMVAEDP